MLFFQAEAGIRADLVTGVQTCALPISSIATACSSRRSSMPTSTHSATITFPLERSAGFGTGSSLHKHRFRSEERRVGKEGTSREWTNAYNTKRWMLVQT